MTQEEIILLSCLTYDVERGRMPDSQSIEPRFESPFATVSKIGHFHSLNERYNKL